MITFKCPYCEKEYATDAYKLCEVVKRKEAIVKCCSCGKKFEIEDGRDLYYYVRKLGDVK